MPKFNFNIASCPETIKTVRDGEPRTATSTLPELLSSLQCPVNLERHVKVKKERNWPLQCNRFLSFFSILFAIHSWPNHQVVHIPWYMCCMMKRTLVSADTPGRLQHTGKGRQRPHPLRKSPFHHD